MTGAATSDPDMSSPPISSPPISSQALFCRQLLLPAAVLWGYRASLAALATLPLSAALASTTAHSPTGARPLFAPGGNYLLETLRLVKTPLMAASYAQLWLVVGGVVLGLIPLGFAVASVLDNGRSASKRFVDAIRHFPRLLLLQFTSIAAYMAVVYVFGSLSAKLRDALRNTLPISQADITTATFVLLGALMALAVGMTHDLARAGVGHHGHTAKASLRLGIYALGSRLVWLVGLRLLTLFGGALLVAVTAALVTKIDVHQSGVWRVIAVALTHQVTLLLVAGLQCVWLRGVVLTAAAEYARHHISEPPRSVVATPLPSS